MPGSSTSYLAPSSEVKVESRFGRHGHKGGVLWFTGLSGSGKTTLAIGLEQALFKKGFRIFVLDGDNLRLGLNSDLGFSESDRRENIRRVTEVAATLKDAGTVVICSFISPFRSDRERSAKAIGIGFYEIFANASLEVCESRDPKGLYKKARAGEIQDFTGVSSPYEAPLNPAMTLDTENASVDACLAKLEVFVGHVFGCS